MEFFLLAQLKLLLRKTNQLFRVVFLTLDRQKTTLFEFLAVVGSILIVDLLVGFMSTFTVTNSAALIKHLT